MATRKTAAETTQETPVSETPVATDGPAVDPVGEYAERPYADAITPGHLAFLQEHHPDQAPA